MEFRAGMHNLLPTEGLDLACSQIKSFHWYCNPIGYAIPLKIVLLPSMFWPTEEKVAVAQLNSLFPEAVGAESNLQKGRLVPCLKSRGKRAHHIPTNKVPMP
ncbi:unnamed protein product [Darwinula stevensoni]|uniref:Uncharacterized protein n=1 Tax=Darwinula stevensoni TaxID=69355 RepID=A0A7R9ABZ2_9CRUS|nr:unnamed protein product [Darwinula stevensoni]CAG0899388.1 unnamed protein product [Darwinula stevensoni]